MNFSSEALEEDFLKSQRHEEGISNCRTEDGPVDSFRSMRVIVIGAGFSGIYCGIRMKERLHNVQIAIYEKNEGLGGTWWENRYPGCACDVPAHSYQYSFEPNPNWSSFYAPAGEICNYLTTVAKKYSADRFIHCRHRVKECRWDANQLKWRVSVEDLNTQRVFLDEADVVVSARGTLNAIAWPQISGLAESSIPKMHSALWDTTYDFQGKRIGIIGGGSSAIQIVPQLQKLSGSSLSCFVRSKTWISRPFGDSATKKLGLKELTFTSQQRDSFSRNPAHLQDFRLTIEREANSVHGLTLRDSNVQRLARDDFTNFMRQRVSKKPQILDTLLPGFSVGCRRLTPGPGYLEALMEDNVELISDPIVQINPDDSVELASGRKIILDVLVCATGFHTSAPPPFPVLGKNGVTMASRFSPYPETYLSVATDGFPNYFMMLGPNSAIGTGSLTMMIEMEGDYIIKCIRKLQKERINAMEVKPARVRDFSSAIEQYFKKTVYLDQCASWYRSEGGTGPRITGLWPGSALHAMETLRSPRWEDFDYVYGEEEDGREVNQLAFMGNGWVTCQTRLDDGDRAWYLQPEYCQIPASPFPEDTKIWKMRPFSH